MNINTTQNIWEQVANLRLRLRSHVNLYHHLYRGQTWYVLQDRAAANYYRFDAKTEAFLQQLDGTRTIQQIIDNLYSTMPETAPSQEEIVQLLAQLRDADLVVDDTQASTHELSLRGRKNQMTPWLQRLLRPLSMRFPLADPDRWLIRLLPSVAPVFSRAGFFVWSTVVLFAFIAAITHWGELSAHWSSRAMDPYNIVLLLLLYPIIKALHECGHALATRNWGGEVHETGIMLLVFIPVPYVNATAASAFVNKWRRALVGAAGIMVELFLAALGMIIWLNVQSGLISDIAFDVMLIGSISTLLFNGNPLLRFDGYYVLMDVIEIPNLGSRANKYLGYLVKHYVFKLPGSRSPVSAPGERTWFVIYGISAFCYRLFISFSIALFVAGKFFIIGIALASWAIVVQVLFPLYRNTFTIFNSAALAGQSRRATAISTGSMIVLFIALFLLPVPSWTNAQGILRLPDNAIVRAGTDGFVLRVLQTEGKRVTQGTPLFELEDPQLRVRRSVLQWKLKELNARKTAEMLVDRTRASILQHEIVNVQTELADIEDRINRQTVTSQTAGLFLPSGGDDLQGHFVKMGTLLGHVADFSTVRARVVVPQDALDYVRRHTESIEIRLSAHPGVSLPGSFVSEVPQIDNQLPSSLLGTQRGGAIAVDARDSTGRRSIDQVFQLDIALPRGAVSGQIGSKVHVRFNHSAEPLGWQCLRSLRQLLLGRLAI